MERKLAAILCADVFGYSRLMGEDEEATLRTLTSYRKLIDSSIEQHHGRFVNSAGDSVLAEFLGLDPHTIARGRRQLLDQEVEVGRIRHPGAGRKPVEKKRPK